MIVLGLDLSSVRSGWAIIKNGRFYNRLDIDYGFISPPKKFSAGEKLTYFREILIEVLSRNIIDIICLEDVFALRNVNTLKVLCEYRGIARGFI